ncbi:MAG: histidine kinase dimerization/phospho-acceptor domain-containing protein, partial [Ramlibacter sp.]
MLGRRVLRMLLWPVVLFYGMTQPRARRASLDYLRRMRRAHGVPAGEPGLAHWLRHLMSFAETLLDKLLATAGRYAAGRVRLEGQDAVGTLLASGRGALLVTAHVGCLELCQSLASQYPDLRLTVLVHTRHAERFQAILRRLNPGSRVELLQVTDVSAATAVDLERRVKERTEELTRLNDALARAKGEAEEANVSKTRFLAAASHDILQPLNAARLYVTSLVERQGSGDDGQLVSNVDASLEAVEEILGALLDI